VAWTEAMLRGQKVFARASEDGRLLSEGGRVEIRYKQNDGRAYRAAAGNLTLLPGAQLFPDTHCAEAAAAPTKGAQEKAKKADRKSVV
jgi:ribonuclease HI